MLRTDVLWLGRRRTQVILKPNNIKSFLHLSCLPCPTESHVWKTIGQTSRLCRSQYKIKQQITQGVIELCLFVSLISMNVLHRTEIDCFPKTQSRAYGARLLYDTFKTIFSEHTSHKLIGEFFQTDQSSFDQWIDCQSIENCDEWWQDLDIQALTLTELMCSRIINMRSEACELLPVIDREQRLFTKMIHVFS